MYERIVEQVAGRSGLSQDKTKQLLGMLIGLIFNEKRGGPAGFLQTFRDKGLGDVVSSWVGHGANQPIDASQLESVLGSDTLAAMSRKLGLPQSTVTDASAALLPDAMDSLSEHGNLPVGGISDTLRHWFGDLGEGLGNIEHWGHGLGVGIASAGAGAAAAAGAGMHKAGDMAGDATRAVGAGLGKVGDVAGDTADAAKSGLGKLLPWLLVGAAVIAVFLMFRGCQKQDATMPEAAAPTAAEATAAGDTAASDAASAAADAAANAASEALDKLTPGNFSADDLVKALNLMIIHFDTGSANISADSADILKKAAEAIKAAPTGTKIEVGGHTDNSGNAASNQGLSERRAAAVKARLTELGVTTDSLSSKGYGQDKPIADNATDDGRAKNRRIEFTVQP